jgi:GR25 family glycosyltransferase involved in LPS biosynthesis
MIVKNEAHVIENTLNNILKYIPLSYYVISDTGSTDNTQQIIKTFFDSKNIEGEIYDDPWQDFGTNRTLALNYAYNKSDYLFIFDADDSIHGNLILPDKLESDKYLFKFGDKFTYKRPLLINNRKKWKYVGVLHEYLENIDPVNGEVYLDSDYYIDSGRTGNRSKDPMKYSKDALVLEKAFEEEQSKNNRGLAGRYAFYLAQSYKDSGNIDKSIMWYEKVLNLDNWLQEKYYSCLKLGELYNQKDDFKKSIYFFLESIKYDNERMEGVVCAAELFHKNGMHLMVNLLYERFKDCNWNINPSDKLFLDLTKYDSFLEYFNSISAYYSNNLDSAYQSLKRIIINKKLAIPFLDVSINNLFFLKNNLIKDNDNDNIDNINLYFKNFNSILSELGRDRKINNNHFELWKILYNKVKPNLIKYNKDRNSSINKNSNINKDSNINIILTITTCKRFDLFEQTINSILNTWLDIDKIDYWYCIDDNSSTEDREKMRSLYPWIDFHMKSLDEKGHLKSMNMIYSKLNELKPKYWIHLEDDFLFFDKMNYIESAIKGLEVMKDHNVKQVLFNRSYGEEIDGYNIISYIKVDNNYSIHHFDPVKNSTDSNCYYWPHYSFRPSLVDVESILKLGNFDSKNTFFEMDYAKRWTESGYKSGFFNKITNLHIGRLTKDRNNKDILNAYQMNNEEQFKSSNSNSNNNNTLYYKNNYKQITNSENNNNNHLFFNTGVIKIFENNNFDYKTDIMMNALSHYKLWSEIINDDKNSYYLVIEDNAHFLKDFDKKMELLDNYLVDKDMILLGYKEVNTNQKKYNTDNENKITINLLDKSTYSGTLFAYTINKNGAKKLIDYIEKNGIKDEIGILIKNVEDLKICECNPPLVKDIEDQFVFVSGYDQLQNDIYYSNQPNKNIDFYKLLALNNDQYVAFNTLGFFKNKLDKLTVSPYFKNGDGIYIKKEYYQKWKKDTC